MRSIRQLLPLLLSLISVDALTANDLNHDIGGLTRQAMQDWKVPGLALAVIKDGEIALLEGYGYRDVERQLPVTEDTLFVGASTTKAFTAFAIGMLVDEGKLAWDTPVDRYLDDFELSDRDISASVTVRDMLSHRTGMPRHDYLWYTNPDITRKRIVASLPTLEITQPLRAKWQYNNLMYLTAGYLIESLTGENWEDFTRSEIFKPLNMRRTNFSIEKMEKDKNAAKAYKENEDQEIVNIPLRRVGNIGPAGSINSSAKDYANWVKTHLNGGQFGKKNLVQETTLNELHKPHMPIGGKPEFSEFSHAFYALGWFTDTYRGHRRVQHGGNLDGFTALVTLFPDRKMGSVIFVNKESSALPRHLSLDIADRMLGLEPANWTSRMLERRSLALQARDQARENKSSLRRPDSPHAHPIVAYQGVYKHPGYGKVYVEQGRNEGSLSVRYHTSVADLEHWHFEVFNSSPTKPEDDHLDNKRFQFQTNVDGFISAVEVDFEVTAAPIVFEKQTDPKLEDEKYLQKYAGRYRYLDQVWEVSVVGSQLNLSIPGQPAIALVPEVNGDFSWSNISVVSMEFVEEADSVTGLKLKQPSGVIDIERINN